MREIVLDTETTGLDPLDGHRLVEVGCVELVNRIPSGHTFHAYFNPERFTLLRNLLATTGGALVGATAIGFSVVMIAVQLNFARMPHGLFRKLSSDIRLLGTFAATFLLAIGVSARAGAIGLATVLIIGFALHNATEGFGIVGPLGGVRPSWKWLGLAGLVGGGPTFLGAMLGYQVHSGPLELAFYALAGGAILYVIGEIWGAVRRYNHRELGLYLLAGGFLLGVATDLIVSYGGG